MRVRSSPFTRFIHAGNFGSCWKLYLEPITLTKNNALAQGILLIWAFTKAGKGGISPNIPTYIISYWPISIVISSLVWSKNRLGSLNSHSDSCRSRFHSNLVWAGKILFKETIYFKGYQSILKYLFLEVFLRFVVFNTNN